MNKKIVQRTAFLGFFVFIILSAILWFNKNMFSLSPWDNTSIIQWSSYACKNADRIAIVENAEKTIIVLNHQRELICQIDAGSNAAKSFSNAEYIELDENNNLYILDKRFAGAFEENAERILKYSPSGKFIEEIYACRYINEDFIITKGKICGITYFDGAIYILRLEHDGFYLERVSVTEPGKTELVRFFDYPDAFKNLGYGRINGRNNMLAVVTKAGGIKQYDFSGNLVSEWPPQGNNRPWSVISDNNNNLISNDINTNQIVLIDTAAGEQTVLYEKKGSLYYYLNYVDETLFAVSQDDDILIMDRDGNFESLNSFTYPSGILRFRIILFVVCLIDVLAVLIFILACVYLLSKVRISGYVKRILLVVLCVAFGAGISSFFIINEMNARYFENIYTDLENVSRLIADNIDADVLDSLVSSAQIEDPEYKRLSNDIKTLFLRLPFKGMQVYQYIWVVRDGVVCAVYDTEDFSGVLYPYTDYEDSYHQEVAETKKYVYTNDITAAGSWLFACGPIFDDRGNMVAAIETGYNMNAVLEQTRNMIIQTLLIVIATTIAFLLIMIEFILIMNAYKKNKLEWQEGAAMPFRPELLRAIVFFQFFSANLAAALLPMYATRLYEPVFNLPREFVVTFPFTTEVIAVVLSQLIIPGVFKKVSIKQIGLAAVALFVIGNGLCFIAVNVLALSLGYALIGFSGGTLVLVVNAVISAQKSVEDVNSGFAHYNASYLAGVNVGVVCGSIVAQFFDYRIVFLFSTVFSAVLLIIFIVSTRSKYLRYFYDMTAYKKTADSGGRQRSGKKFAFLRFIIKPVVFVTLLLGLLPYAASMSFTGYFLPVFGIDNGLGESNIGQLILLSGLFAILFGTSLCKYFGQKFPIKVVLCFSLLLNAAAVYLFSINVSVIMLIAAVVIIAVANIFALTNIQTYYATLYQGSGISSMTALSFYAIVENAAMMVGPIVFSYILASNIAGGMKIFSVALLVCLVVFMVVSTVFGKKKKPGLGLLGRARQIRESLAA
jgi:predicted MFS family arabinose efflux permease